MKGETPEPEGAAEKRPERLLPKTQVSAAEDSIGLTPAQCRKVKEA